MASTALTSNTSTCSSRSSPTLTNTPRRARYK